MKQIRPAVAHGRLRAPASKSYTHRAFVMAAWSGNGLVRNPLRSDDTEATLRVLKDLGFMVVHEAQGTRVGGRPRPARRPVHAGSSGTTLRLLVPMAATIEGTTGFEASAQLARRPLGPLLSALSSLGSRVEGSAVPLSVTGPLAGGQATLPGDESSQYVSGLLMASPFARSDVEVRLSSPLLSRPYVDITLGVMAHHGLRVQESSSGFVVQAPQTPRQKPFDVPGDWSAAAHLFAVGLASRGKITLDGLRVDDAQGDRAILDHLSRFGAHVSTSGDAVTVEGNGLEGATIDVGPTPDLFPALCAVAAVAKGRTVLYGAPHLRWKESDRVAAMAENLQRFGLEVTERRDGLEIVGGRAQGTTIADHGDHRIAMACVAVALGAQGASTLAAPDVVAKSYPKFFEDLATLLPEVNA